LEEAAQDLINKYKSQKPAMSLSNAWIFYKELLIPAHRFLCSSKMSGISNLSKLKNIPIILRYHFYFEHTKFALNAASQKICWTSKQIFGM
jgi:hypothetical protein